MLINWGRVSVACNTSSLFYIPCAGTGTFIATCCQAGAGYVDGSSYHFNYVAVAGQASLSEIMIRNQRLINNDNYSCTINYITAGW